MDGLWLFSWTTRSAQEETPVRGSPTVASKYPAVKNILLAMVALGETTVAISGCLGCQVERLFVRFSLRAAFGSISKWGTTALIFGARVWKFTKDGCGKQMSFWPMVSSSLLNLPITNDIWYLFPRGVPPVIWILVQHSWSDPHHQGAASHDASLLVLPHALLKEVGLPLQGNHLHPGHSGDARPGCEDRGAPMAR